MAYASKLKKLVFCMAVQAKHPVNSTLEAFAIIRSEFVYGDKKEKDPSFKAFVTQYDAKIKKLFNSCFQGFIALQSPALTEAAKKVMNGPLQVIVRRPSDHFKVVASTCCREPLGDLEFQEAIRRWCTNSTAYVCNFLTFCPVENIKQFLDAGEGAEITIVASDTESFTFVGPQVE